MVKFEIEPSKTAFILVDVVKAWFGAGASHPPVDEAGIVRRLNRLISVCRQKGILIIFIQPARRKDGSDDGLARLFERDFVSVSGGVPLPEGTSDVEICDEIDRRKEDIVVNKRSYSAFYGSDLDLVLRNNGVDTIIIGGTLLWTCCEATARDARHRNYKVIFLSDGNGYYPQLADQGWGTLSGEEVKKAHLTVLATRIADVSSVEEVIGRVSKT